MNRISIVAILLFIFQSSSAQQQAEVHQADSTLIKMVRGIRQVIENRARDTNYPNRVLKAWPDQVSVVGIRGGVYIDSLFRYNIKDFRSISIEFGIHPAIGGSMAPFGKIYLHRQERSDFFHFYQHPHKRQGDSTLVKMVGRIRQVIENRAKEADYPDSALNAWPKTVSVKGVAEPVQIDSLYRYDIIDFKAISIELDIDPAIGGPMSPYGLIYLHRKDQGKPAI